MGRLVAWVETITSTSTGQLREFGWGMRGALGEKMSWGKVCISFAFAFQTSTLRVQTELGYRGRLETGCLYSQTEKQFKLQ